MRLRLARVHTAKSSLNSPGSLFDLVTSQGLMHLISFSIPFTLTGIPLIGGTGGSFRLVALTSSLLLSGANCLFSISTFSLALFVSSPRSPQNGPISSFLNVSV